MREEKPSEVLLGGNEIISQHWALWFGLRSLGPRLPEAHLSHSKKQPRVSRRNDPTAHALIIKVFRGKMTAFSMGVHITTFEAAVT